MEITNSELLTAHSALLELANVPLKTCGELAQLIVKLEEPLRVFSIMRETLMRKYEVTFEPQPDGNTKVSSKKDGNAQKFGGEWNELLAMTVEIDTAKVKLPCSVRTTPVALLALKKFVEI